MLEARLVVGVIMLSGIGVTCGNSAPLSGGGAGTPQDASAAAGAGGRMIATPDGGDGATGRAGAAGVSEACGAGGAGGAFSAGGAGGMAGATAVACGFEMPNPVSTGLPNPASYVNNGDGTVTDNVTGLVWEGSVELGSYTQAQAAMYCALLSGAWRLPTVLELASLQDTTIPVGGIMINQTYFSDTPSASFWTSSPYAADSHSAWFVSFFGEASSSVASVGNPKEVRCVRAAPACLSPHYRSQGAGVVYDEATKLTWQQIVDPGVYRWGAAQSYCAALGTGWRVPSLTELQTVVDYTHVTPAIDDVAFPNTPPKMFWTSSITNDGLGNAWFVQFFDGSTQRDYGGGVGNLSPGADLKVRCVSSAPGASLATGAAGAGGAGAGGVGAATGAAGMGNVNVGADEAECLTKRSDGMNAVPYSTADFCAVYEDLCGQTQFTGNLTGAGCQAVYDGREGKTVQGGTSVQSCVTYHLCNAQFSAPAHCPHAAGTGPCAPL